MKKFIYLFLFLLTLISSCSLEKNYEKRAMKNSKDTKKVIRKHVEKFDINNNLSLYTSNDEVNAFFNENSYGEAEITGEVLNVFQDEDGKYLCELLSEKIKINNQEYSIPGDRLLIKYKNNSFNGVHTKVEGKIKKIKKRSSSFGVIGLETDELIYLKALPGAININNHEENSSEGTLNLVFSSLGLNLQEYSKEKLPKNVHTTIYSVGTYTTETTHNYNNFTREHIENFFGENERTLADVIYDFGKPDSIIISYEPREPNNLSKYHLSCYWKDDVEEFRYILISANTDQPFSKENVTGKFVNENEFN